MTVETSKEDKKNTPRKWEQAKDINADPNADQHPNIYRKKTRSGHVFELNDSKGAEHVTLQHRSGSKIQFKPDGAIEMTSHNGAYHIIFGENRMKITGAYDVTVDGAASLKVNKDYNFTVSGDCNFTVEKDFNITAKNMNQTVRENIHTVGKNMTTKIDEAINIESQTQTLSAEKGMTVQSVNDSAIVAGKKNLGLRGGQNVMMEAGINLDLKSGTQMNFDSPTVSFKGSQTVAMEGTDSFSIKTNKLGIKTTEEMRFYSQKEMRIMADEQIHAVSPALLGSWAGVGIKQDPVQNSLNAPKRPTTITFTATKTTADSDA